MSDLAKQQVLKTSDQQGNFLVTKIAETNFFMNVTVIYSLYFLRAFIAFHGQRRQKESSFQWLLPWKQQTYMEKKKKHTQIILEPTRVTPSTTSLSCRPYTHNYIIFFIAFYINVCVNPHLNQNFKFCESKEYVSVTYGTQWNTTYSKDTNRQSLKIRHFWLSYGLPEQDKYFHLHELREKNMKTIQPNVHYTAMNLI